MQSFHGKWIRPWMDTLFNRRTRRRHATVLSLGRATRVMWRLRDTQWAGARGGHRATPAANGVPRMFGDLTPTGECSRSASKDRVPVRPLALAKPGFSGCIQAALVPNSFAGTAPVHAGEPEACGLSVSVPCLRQGLEGTRELKSSSFHVKRDAGVGFSGVPLRTSFPKVSNTYDSNITRA